MNNNQQAIVTQDLVIKKLDSNNMDDFNEMILQKDVANMAGFSPVASFVNFYMSQMLQNGAWGLFNHQNKLVGIVCIYDLSKSKDELKIGEIGFMVNHNYWNKGYMSQAINAIFNYIKHEYTQIKGIILTNNIASKKVLEKTGFKLLKKIEEENQEKLVYIKYFN